MSVSDRTWSRDQGAARQIAHKFMDLQASKTPWEQFLHGIASTHEISAAMEPTILNALHTVFPTPEDARVRCGTDVGAGIRRAKEVSVKTRPDSTSDERANERSQHVGGFIGGVQNRVNALSFVCKAAEDWDRVEALLTACPAGKADFTNTCDIAGRKEGPCAGGCGGKCKVNGLGLKGADLTKLYEGCDVPVPDQWLIWHLASTVEPKVTRPSRNIRSKEGSKGWFDTPFKDFASQRQTAAVDYKRYRDAAIKQARAEGLSPAEWHYATWLDLVLCRKSDPETGACQDGRIEDAEEFINLLAAAARTTS